MREGETTMIINKKAPVDVASINKGNELSTGSQTDSTPRTTSGKPLVFHIIINTHEVRRGNDHVLRSLCGKRIALPKAVQKPSRAAVKQVPSHTFCQTCYDLKALEEEIVNDV
ncbi:hypothetical protein HF851_08355 [Corynebacterium ammoniagenes]|uniref:hypothetical protein n=1 Tax=Corynebacterium ammoniagenes TaxID=1697 RepID=UPI001459A1CD|nr:hypothetical protein [Corynebacterium ammoniagenes]NMF32288.1 hypothetical protein [Corynebacterium ammoniagenes]